MKETQKLGSDLECNKEHLVCTVCIRVHRVHWVHWEHRVHSVHRVLLVLSVCNCWMEYPPDHDWRVCVSVWIRMQCMYLYVCWCICMYRFLWISIYEYLLVSCIVSVCICLLHVFAPTTRKPQPRPQNTASSWSANRQAALARACAQSLYFANNVPHGDRILRIPRAAPSNAPEAPLWLRKGGPHSRSACINQVILVPCPVATDSACWTCLSCPGASATAPPLPSLPPPLPFLP